MLRREWLPKLYLKNVMYYFTFFLSFSFKKVTENDKWISSRF